MAAPPVPRIPGPGGYSLHRLGYGPVLLRRSDARPAPPAGTEWRLEKGLRFALPARAHQRERRDHKHFRYEVRLDAVVTVAADSGPGLLYLDAKVNGWDFGHIGFDPVRRGGRIVATRWGTANWLGGRGGVVRGRTVRIRFRNVPVLQSLHGGVNRISFAIDTFGDARFVRVRVAPTTRIVWNRM